LAQYGIKRALAVFTSANSSNYRLSLITIDLKLEGRRVQKEYSNPRRYSFFLGPEAKIHTPEEYLVKQGRIEDFEDLKNRFSIEVVNKDFYTKIAILFTQLAGGKRKIGRKTIDAGRGLLDLPGTTNDTLDKEFTVRLIGRLVFCWFLKKKCSDKNISLLPERVLSVTAVLKNKNYYHNILEPLFFEVLNTPIKDREKKYQELPWLQIPFLNGGLFTPHHYDFYEPGPLGISKFINMLKIPDHWLKELFEVFEIYNFTIDENTSVDVELSIEPEMLGRIFENLLAEINPETGETARKASGSYYTPRPIVDYMVDESLKQYLLTKTKVHEDKIKQLLTYENIEVNLTDSEKESILIALDMLKVIDPACGSGAFPMGILHKILLILQKIDPKSEWWLDKMLSRIGNKTLERKLKVENVNYVHKLGIIQNAIFGIDIQPIAVEISKLRFFLSLIVDETVNDSKKNRGIEPLPNLEFKFVCADSLIGLPKNDTQKTLIEADDDIKLLRDLRDEYLRSYGREKRRVEKKFFEVQSKMAKHALSWSLWGGEKSQTMKLSQWNPFSEESCSWFDSDWMFGIKEGFDIVIGNPPYGVSIRGGYRTKLLSHLGKVPDYEIYYFFIELAYKLLKNNAVKTYIIPNTILFNVFAVDYRNKLLQNWHICEILDCTNLIVFEAATVRNIVTIFLKKNSCVEIGYRNTACVENFEKLISRPRMRISKKALIENNQNWGLVFRLPKQVLQLTLKIKKSKETLSNYFPDITQGLIAYDKYRGQTAKTIKSRKYHFVSNVKEGLKPWLWGEDVKRYQVVWNGKEYIDYCDGIANPREPKYFRGPRLLVREITNPSIYAAFTEEELYNDPSIINILPGQDIDIKALLAILNSRLATFLHFNSSPKATKGAFPKILVEDLKNFPLIELNEKTKTFYKSLVKAVTNLIDCKSDNSKKDVLCKLERQIDQMVYKLYGLSKEEIEVIERSLTA